MTPQMAVKENISGRKSVKGFHAINVQHKLISYELGFKRSVLEFLEIHGIQKTIYKFWPESKLVSTISAMYSTKRSLIYKWKKTVLP
jgi:hypothetical protein